MKTEDEIRKAGLRAMHTAIVIEGSREEGQELGAWWFAEWVLGETFECNEDPDESAQWLKDNPE